jgi:hypothetical protein
MFGKKQEEEHNIWMSFSDLFSGFMVIFIVISLMLFNRTEKELAATKKQLAEINRIEDALKNLDKKFFDFDEMSKRYRLKADVNFLPNSSNILDIPIDKREGILLEAGQNIHKLMVNLEKTSPNIDYLLVIEGFTQRNSTNYLSEPDKGYKLSYERALSLTNYWSSNSLDFKKFKNCEIIIAGSGYFGKSRDEKNEDVNRRFSIQITPKLRKLDNYSKQK